jgi:hypothetical protein
MTSPSKLLLASLALALAACASTSPQPTGPSSGPTAPTGPTPPRHAAASADSSTPPAAKLAQPTTPGPNLTPDGVVFNYKPDGKPNKLFLAGNFNDWNPANEKYLLKDDDGDGIWSITVKLPPGTYQYKFVIDGNWTKDPNSPSDAPDGFGGRNGKFDVK